jgi:sigma-B regulation protein RsbU (phosphoserine phosphatase)
VVADVAGHGIAAALVVAAARTAIRTEAERDAEPGRLLGRLNRLLVGSLPSGMFLTMFVGVLDLNSGRLRFASAGHPHPFWWSEAMGVISDLESSGVPLGLLEDADYPEGEVGLDPGDFVIAYTDGLVEALDVNRQMYGFDRAREAVYDSLREGHTIGERLDHLVARVAHFTDGHPAEDDVTLVGLAVPPGAPLGLALANGTRIELHANGASRPAARPGDGTDPGRLA